MNYLLEGMLIGLLFGVPLGAVGAITLQRALNYGFWQGMISGLGSSCVDVIYACAGVFGISLISNIMERYQTGIRIIGAAFIIVIACRIMMKKEADIEVKKDERTMFASSFLIALTNPTAIFSFLFAFSLFEIPASIEIFDGVVLVLGVFCGTMIWWFILSKLAVRLKSRMSALIQRNINRGFAGILILNGFFIIIGTLR